MRLVKSLCFAILLAVSASVYAADKLNVNDATAEQISHTMKGVGAQKAERIVVYRKSHGPFTNIDQLMQVKGIGTKTIEANRDLITTKKPSETP